MEFLTVRKIIQESSVNVYRSSSLVCSRRTVQWARLFELDDCKLTNTTIVCFHMVLVYYVML